MSAGYAGKIARINLSTGAVTLIDTNLYEDWIGGHGIGAALFYDIVVKEKNINLEEIDGFHPDNLTTVMTSPFTGTVVPAAGGRIEIQGIGVNSYPKDWYTKSLIGGRIGHTMKFAGYDGLAIEGAASEPVWIDIRDESITIRPCSELGLWGKDTVETQEAIWSYVMADRNSNAWYSPEGANGQTTQKPAVITIGTAGETRCRPACLIHDAAFAAGAGGFGAVWGGENLKAVSVIGTGNFPVADPAALVRERVEHLAEYGPDINDFTVIGRSKAMLRHNNLPQLMEAYGKSPTHFLGNLINEMNYMRPQEKGPASCMSCYGGCRARYSDGVANEAHCAGCFFYAQADSLDIQAKATDMINRVGLNTFDFFQGVPYLKVLSDKGILGPAGSGAEIETDLDFSDFGKIGWAERFLKTVVERDTPFGDAVAEGFARALEHWGRLDDMGDPSDTEPSIPLPYWGIPEHHYDARCMLEYGYGSILGDREVCEHLFAGIYWDSYFADNMPMNLRGLDATALEAATLVTEKMLPYATEYYSSTEEAMQMMDFGDKNMYSEHCARRVAWDRHNTRFFKATLLVCDLRYPDIINTNKPDKRGSSFTVESDFLKTVTGKDLSYLECMELGRKIWNLDNAIWTLQGRHRDMVYFADYIHRDDYPEEWKMPVLNPNAARPNRRWSYADVGHRHIDREGFDQFKTYFYTLEGWDPATGWPNRSTLEELGMRDVADSLQQWGKLGSK